MQAADCRLVAASGNQYEQLRRHFSEVADEIGYVCENGSQVQDGSEVLFVADVPVPTIERVLGVLEARASLQFVANTAHGACVLDSMSDGFYDYMAFCHPRIARVASLEEVKVLDRQVLHRRTVRHFDRVGGRPARRSLPRSLPLSSLSGVQRRLRR